MKIDDIKVGVEYAVIRSNSDYESAIAHRAVVLETDGVTKQEGAYRYGRRTIRAVKVKYLAGIREGQIEVVASREVRETWETFALKVKAKKERQRQDADKKDADGVKLFERMLTVDKALRLLYPDRSAEPRIIYGAEVGQAQRAGWTVSETSALGGPRPAIETVIRYDVHGRIHPDDALDLASAIMAGKEVWATRNLSDDEIWEHDDEKTARYYGNKRDSDVLRARRTPWLEVR